MKKPNYASFNEIILWAKEFKPMNVVAGVPESEVNKQINIVMSWPKVVSILETSKLDVNETDFKYYLLSALSYMYDRDKFEERQVNRIRNLFQEYQSPS